jgi:V/A-type H+-transporting ATPase subunit E
MNGKENIIAKIIESAENSRKNTLFEANEKIKQIESDTDIYISALNKKTDAEIAEMQKNTVSRRKSVADLDVKKIILKAKHSVLDAAFVNAESKVLKLSDKEYKTFIKKLITSYAENGDIVLISENDRKKIDKTFIDDISKSSGLKLGFDYSDDFNGGVILQSNICNKNLTLETLMKQIRENIESEVASILF